MIESRCGLKCNTCEWKGPMGCKGCMESNGDMAWGTCKLAKCCMDKKHNHCGKCGKFPCDELNEFAYDKEHGNNGERLETLKTWIKEE
ncbi:MAG TPA: hypothetical protein DEP72_09100 [Clostridiales bacterium]|nr:MAG: hypothetical protein A2Y18_05910 [Clostridiales bacterium GWD2_32_19]HCC08296.1 hypothetical protein [Clostridiales bacterium]